jgi:hypothetical protein
LVGAAEGKRKVSWISWERMCVSKQGGGMGFRNYGVFNQSSTSKAGVAHTDQSIVLVC